MNADEGGSSAAAGVGAMLLHEAVASIFEQAPCLIFLKDLQGRYLMANRRFREAFGLTPERILGRTDQEVFPDEQARQFRVHDMQVLGDREPRRFRECAQQDLGLRFNLVEKFPVYDALGSVVALGGIATDITQLEHDRSALEEAEERFRLFTENGLTMAWMKDEEGRFVYVSPSLEAHTGIPAARRLGKRNDEVLPPEVAATMMAHDRQVLESGRSMDVIEEPSYGSGRKQTWFIHKFPLRDRRGARFIGGVAVDITARVELEQALRQQRDRFVLPAFGARIGSHDRDLVRDKIFISSGIAQMLGIGDDPMTWTSAQWHDVIHPDDLQRNKDTLQAHVDGVAPLIDMEYRVRRADGSYRWVRSLGAALRDERGRPTRVIGIMTDITEEKEAQQRELAQQRLTGVIARVQHIFLDENDVAAALRTLLAELLDLTHSEFGFVGEVLHDDQGAPYLKTHAVTDVARDDGSCARHGDGAPLPELRNLRSLTGTVLRTQRPVICNDPATDPHRGGMPAGCPPVGAFLGLPFSKRNEMLGMIGVAKRRGGYDEALVDYLEPLLVTCANILWNFREQEARRAAQAASRAQEERYRLLVEMSPDAVILHLDTTQFLYANAAALRLLDARSFDDLRDRRPVDFLEPPFRDLARARMRRILSGDPHVPTAEMRLRTLAGAVKDIEAVASRAIFEGKPAVQAVWRDITVRKSTHERELRSRRLEALGILAGGVAHDFNNVLSAIHINTDLALHALPSESGAKEHLDQVKVASARATTLVHQILRFSRAGTEKREPVCLRDVVREVLGMLRATIPQLIELRDQMAAAVPPVEANVGQIHQVVMNLITNAIHAIGRNRGRIDVEVSVLPGGTTIAAGEGGHEQVRLRVADDGCGMDAHTVERIFDPFYTTKGPGEGVGLGLSVVHEIMRSHEGRIEVSSRVGHGSVFDLYFPATRRPLATPRVASAPVAGDGSSVLFLDDDPLVSFAGERMLTAAGFRVTAMRDPVAALQAFRARPERFDALVVDLSMPGMNGLDFVRAARALRADVPIVLASGYFQPSDEIDARALGVTQLVAKPYDVRQLSQALASAKA